jgi:hypothetical protein
VHPLWREPARAVARGAAARTSITTDSGSSDAAARRGANADACARRPHRTDSAAHLLSCANADAVQTCCGRCAINADLSCAGRCAIDAKASCAGRYGVNAGACVDAVVCRDAHGAVEARSCAGGSIA